MNNSDINLDIFQKFVEASKAKNFNILKHIVKSPKLREKCFDGIDTDQNIMITLFNSMIRFEHKEVLEFLVGLKEIRNQKTELTRIFSNSFAIAAGCGDIERVEFIYDGFKEYIDTSHDDYWCFRGAYKSCHEEVLTFLIMKLGMDKSIEAVRGCLDYEHIAQSKLICERLFPIKMMNEHLDKKLLKKEEKTKKYKM